MTAVDVWNAAPLIALTATAAVLLLAAAFWPRDRVMLTLTLLGLAATMGVLALPAASSDQRSTNLLVFDDYALVFIGLIVAATAAVAVLSHSWLGRRGHRTAEFQVLLVSAALGAATLASAAHFAAFFIGLEILSVALYALIAYPVTEERFIEAAVKYLVLAGATSAFLLFGMALFYAGTGHMELPWVLYILSARGGPSALVVVSVVLMLVGVGFKLALVPFHMWTPDIYQGAPPPVTAFVATVSKAGVFAVLLRFFRPIALDQGSTLFLVVAAVAVASMVAGNLLALRQDDVKRILAYSSIAHLGYVLVAFLAGGRDGVSAAVFYLVAYTVTNLAAFGVVGALSGPRGDAGDVAGYAGLGRRRPWLAAVFAVALFSLAGIPLTAGFVGKFYLVTAGAGAALWGLLVVLVLASTVGLYYYTRIIVAMYVRDPEEGLAAVPRFPRPAAAATLVLALLAAALLILGVYPGPLVDLIQTAAASLH